MATSVRFENVSKRYGGKLAIKNLSFQCEPGEFFTIVGPAGAGKSTILKMIAGIEPVTSGNIYFNEIIVNELSPGERDISMAFETYNLYPHFTVYENIAFPCKAAARKEKISKQEEHKRVVEIANFLGITKLLDRKPVELSGGEKQRVSLARALIRECECYLLDEPIAHLDARLRFSTQTGLKRLSRKLGAQIIYVTHDYRSALGMSDRIAVLRNGEIEQLGTSEEVFNKPRTDFVANFIGDPPCNLVDGEIVNANDKIVFRTGDDFSVSIPVELAGFAEKVVWQENGMRRVRLGVRPFNVTVSKNKVSENSFQLPIYSIVRSGLEDILSFELKNSFFRAISEISDVFNAGESVWLDIDFRHVFFYERTIKISK